MKELIKNIKSRRISIKTNKNIKKTLDSYLTQKKNYYISRWGDYEITNEREVEWLKKIFKK